MNSKQGLQEIFVHLMFIVTLIVRANGNNPSVPPQMNIHTMEHSSSSLKKAGNSDW